MATKPNVNNLEAIGLSSFFGGQSVDNKLGTQAQFYDDEHLDFRTNPSDFSVYPGTREATAGMVTGLVVAMDKVISGVKYAADLSGTVYEVSTSEVWSQVGDIDETGGAGLTYRADLDNVYITGQDKLARIFHVSTANTFEPDFFENGVSTCTTCTKTGGAATYTVPTSISEATTGKRPFSSDIEPLRKLGVKVVSKGTGDWTLTLHDDANNVLGTVTIANADLNDGVINYFIFSPAIRIQRGDDGGGSALTYHFHLTSTVADGTVQVAVANELTNSDMELWADALVLTQNELHPSTNFLGFTLIGNGRYVAAYEPLQDSPTTADFNRHRLTFPPGFEVCGFAQKNLMIVIGCEKRSATGEVQEGALFYWDGISETYNDWWPVPEGSPESLFSTQNTAFYIVNGALTQIQSTDQPIKVRTLRNTNGSFTGVSDITHVYPNMMTVHRGMLLMGYPSITTSEVLKHGVFTFGEISREFPISFGFSYTASPGHLYNDGVNNLRLGMIKSYGDKLFISWRDDSAGLQTYGVDIIDNTSDPAPTFSLTPLVYDDERPYAYKKAAYLQCTFAPWPEGATLTLKYKLDDDADWTYSDQTPAVGEQYIVMPVERNFLTATFGLDGTCTEVTPHVSSFYMWVDRLLGERPIGDI